LQINDSLPGERKQKKGTHPWSYREGETQVSPPIKLEDIAIQLEEYINNFRDMFICHRSDNTTTAFQYICGLLQTERPNMERMEEKVADADYESLQQFISSSPWNARDVMNRVALQGDQLLGGTGSTGLILDETAFAKKGKKSVGVARQWNGCLGKTENSQVAVFGALSAGDRVVPVDAELFLPEEWSMDKDRCLSSGVPKDRILHHKTKLELALEIVKRQRSLGVRFDYVCADGLYGNSMDFCKSLDDSGESFMVHIHADKQIYLEDPKPVIPLRRSSRGKEPSKLKAQTECIRVDKFFQELSPDELEKITVRETTEGLLEINAYRRNVWVWDGKKDSAWQCTLFIRQDVKSPEEIKYCFTNAADDIPTLVLARMEAQRFWIERSFEDAKSQAGMADYQVRGWLAWHHHMALVMMTMLFMTKQRMLHKDTCPLLSCYDIKVLLAYFLPRRDATKEEIYRQMEIRHKKRKAASENAKNRRTADRLTPVRI
jgi:SRSO17 transposase